MIDLAIDALSKHGRSEIAHVSVSSVENGSRRPLAATPIAARHTRRLDVPRRIHADACVAMAAGISSVKLPLTLGANVGWRSSITLGGGPPKDGADKSLSSADKSVNAARSFVTAAA